MYYAEARNQLTKTFSAQMCPGNTASVFKEMSQGGEPLATLCRFDRAKI